MHARLKTQLGGRQPPPRQSLLWMVSWINLFCIWLMSGRLRAWTMLGETIKQLALFFPRASAYRKNKKGSSFIPKSRNRLHRLARLIGLLSEQILKSLHLRLTEFRDNHMIEPGLI